MTKRHKLAIAGGAALVALLLLAPRTYRVVEYELETATPYALLFPDRECLVRQAKVASTRMPIAIRVGVIGQNCAAPVEPMDSRVREHLVKNLRLTPSLAGEWVADPAGLSVSFVLRSDAAGWEFGKTYEVSLDQEYDFPQEIAGERKKLAVGPFKFAFALPEPRIWIERKKSERIDDPKMQTYAGEFLIRSNYELNWPSISERLSLRGPGDARVASSGKTKENDEWIEVVGLDTKSDWKLRIDSDRQFVDVGVPSQVVELAIPVLSETEFADLREETYDERFTDRIHVEFCSKSADGATDSAADAASLDTRCKESRVDGRERFQAFIEAWRARIRGGYAFAVSGLPRRSAAEVAKLMAPAAPIGTKKSKLVKKRATKLPAKKPSTMLPTKPLIAPPEEIEIVVDEAGVAKIKDESFRIWFDPKDVVSIEGALSMIAEELSFPRARHAFGLRLDQDAGLPLRFSMHPAESGDIVLDLSKPRLPAGLDLEFKNFRFAQR